MAACKTLVCHPVPSSTPTFPSAQHHPRRTQWPTALCLLLSLASRALASHTTHDLSHHDGTDPTEASEPEELLLLDTQIPVLDHGIWTLVDSTEHQEHHLRERAAITVLPSAAPAATSNPTTTPSSPPPRPFDGVIPDNFTSTSCPVFFNHMLADSRLQECYPVSLMLQSSESFFEAEKSLVGISTVLDYACKADVVQCAEYLAAVARNLTDSSNCGSDYQARNPTISEAFTGLVSYQVVYSATCLKDPQTAAYCFANAVTNQTNPTATFSYYLPLNSSLPAGYVPTCAPCQRDTMRLYHIATANRKQPIANTYFAAAEQVNTLCGPGFANTTMTDILVSRAGPPIRGRAPPWLLPASVLITAVVTCLL